MLSEFLTRLAIALPLVCALAVLSLVVVKRGWLRLPGGRLPFRATGPFAPPPAAQPAMELIGIKALSQAARLAVVRFDGRELLLGVSAGGITLIASAAKAAGTGAPTATHPAATAQNRSTREDAPCAP